jgi:hypothetical protein
MFRKVNLSIAIASVFSFGCATGSGPDISSICGKRSFDEWVSFYDLKDKATGSWPEGYGPAYKWLSLVAKECYPERFEGEGDADTGDEIQNIEESQQPESGPTPEPEGVSEGGEVYQVPKSFFEVEAPDGPQIEKIE